MAKGKLKKAGTRKRREKKNIERGAAHIRSSFNDRCKRQRYIMGIRRRIRLQRFEKEHSLCCTVSSRDSCKGCYGAWLEER